jgi:hypothetical protein
MRAALVALASMAFVAASTFPDLAQVQTPAKSFKPAGAGKQVVKHRRVRKAQSPAPSPPAAPVPILEERPGPKMGM